MTKGNNTTKGGNTIVQSLWVGNKLSRMEYYSIKSFLDSLIENKSIRRVFLR